MSSIHEPLTRFWAQVVDDEQVARKLEQKKKAASKILVRFVRGVGGDVTAAAILVILTRLNAFALAYKRPLINSSRSLPISNPTIDL